MSTPEPQPPRKRRRIFMWVFLAINVLFLIWVITGIASGESCSGKTGDALTQCQAGQAGTTIGVALIVFFWVATDVILGIIYLIVRRR